MRQRRSDYQSAAAWVVALHQPAAISLGQCGQNMDAQCKDARAIERCLDRRVVLRPQVQHPNALPVDVHLGSLIVENLHRIVAAEEPQRDLVAYGIHAANGPADNGALAWWRWRKILRRRRDCGRGN